MLFVAGCGGDDYDDTAIRNEITDLANRVAKLEQLCQQMNTNISSLQTIVNALQKNDYITAVTPITQNGKVVGYTIAFAKSGAIIPIAFNTSTIDTTMSVSDNEIVINESGVYLISYFANGFVSPDFSGRRSCRPMQFLFK